jgi:hypothetical protein
MKFWTSFTPRLAQLARSIPFSTQKPKFLTEMCQNGVFLISGAPHTCYARLQMGDAKD